jgi:nucleotide-binding universal stress UspA family protein/GNAT superfamily N-acetyltransferase
MFGKVLIPADLSDISEKLVACAIGIRGVQDIVLLHIAGAGGLTGAEQDGMEQLRRIAGAGIRVRCIVEEGTGDDIPAAILRTAEAEGASLIVMGARKGLLSRTLLGHGGTEVLTQSRTHVLVMRFPGQGIFNSPPAPACDLFARILFPLDFSRPANDALTSVGMIGGVTELILLHVIRKVEAEDRMNLVVKEVERRLSDARERIKAERPDIRVRMMVRFGDPTRQIAAVADEEEVSLVMMSRYGKQDYIRKVPLGTTTSKVSAQIKKPVLVMFTGISLEIHAREIATSEFFMAEKIWFDYHQTKSDPVHDRIFAVFVEDTPVSVARCKRHEDGYEVDGIYTWEEFRGNGYARYALDALIGACGGTFLYMYAVLHLVNFYGSLGFEPIPEQELPRTIRSRYEWALGDMQSANVCPMKRAPAKDTKSG